MSNVKIDSKVELTETELELIEGGGSGFGGGLAQGTGEGLQAKSSVVAAK